MGTAHSRPAESRSPGHRRPSGPFPHHPRPRRAGVIAQHVHAPCGHPCRHPARLSLVDRPYYLHVHLLRATGRWLAWSGPTRRTGDVINAIAVGHRPNPPRRDEACPEPRRATGFRRGCPTGAHNPGRWPSWPTSSLPTCLSRASAGPAATTTFRARAGATTAPVSEGRSGYGTLPVPGFENRCSITMACPTWRRPAVRGG